MFNIPVEIEVLVYHQKTFSPSIGAVGGVNLSRAKVFDWLHFCGPQSILIFLNFVIVIAALG